MDHYRDLNREMVQEIQTMRVNIRMYCDEIINLRAELMEKHETELNLRKLLYQSIIGNCLQLTEIVKPDADILPLLRETIATPSFHSSQRCVDEGSTNIRRRSIQLTAELRRSNTLISRRSSVRSTSPIRRSDSLRGVEVLEETPSEATDNTEDEQIVENENEEDSALTDTGNSGKDKTKGKDNYQHSEKHVESSNIIYEEHDEEDNDDEEEEWPQHILSSESEQDDNNKSIPSISDDVTHPRESLKDVTNKLDKSKNNAIQINKGQKQKELKKLDNSAEPCISLEKVDSSKKQRNPRKKVTKQLKNKTKKAKGDSSASECEDESIQALRRSCQGTEQKMTDKSIPITQHNNLSGEGNCL